MKKWTKIADNKIQMVWKCKACGEVTVVPPTYYEESGTPCCSVLSVDRCEGDDMVYVRTEILK